MTLTQGAELMGREIRRGAERLDDSTLTCDSDSTKMTRTHHCLDQGS